MAGYWWSCEVLWLSEALVPETVPETLTKEKQKMIINKSSSEQDNCESVGCGLHPTRSKATDNSKHVDNLEELDIKEHVKNVQNSPDVETPETAGQVRVTCQAARATRK